MRPLFALKRLQLQPTLSASLKNNLRKQFDEMAAHRIGKTQEDGVHSSEMGTSREHGLGLQKRHARVTVKYNRKELQKRIDVEKWIDECLDKLYLGKVRS